MLVAMALSTLLVAVAPQNEEVGLPCDVIVAITGATVGALTIGAAAGAVPLFAFSESCAAQQCRDNPAYIVSPIAALAGAIAGAFGGGIGGFLLVRALQPQQDSPPTTPNPDPDVEE